MLDPLPARDEAWLDISASSRVLTKNTVAQAAVERDRKLALPVAPNKLPEEPLPKEAPMSAPLPCCTSTRPIMTSAERICTARRRVIQICMVKFVSERSEVWTRPPGLGIERQAPARQIATKSAAFSEAPPMSPPSMSGCANRAAALSGLTLPPYSSFMTSACAVAARSCARNMA